MAESATPCWIRVSGRSNPRRSAGTSRWAGLAADARSDQRPRPLPLQGEGEVEEQRVGVVAAGDLEAYGQAVDETGRDGDRRVAGDVGRDGERAVVLRPNREVSNPRAEGHLSRE